MQSVKSVDHDQKTPFMVEALEQNIHVAPEDLVFEPLVEEDTPAAAPVPDGVVVDGSLRGLCVIRGSDLSGSLTTNNTKDTKWLTQRRQDAKRGRADALLLMSWRLCVLSEAGVRFLPLATKPHAHKYGTANDRLLLRPLEFLAASTVPNRVVVCGKLRGLCLIRGSDLSDSLTTNNTKDTKWLTQRRQDAK